MRALRSLCLLPLLAALGCPTTSTIVDDDDDTTPAPEPGAFQAGAAVTRMQVPLGIGVTGSAPFGAPDSDTPYADSFPGTTRLHGHPDVRAVVYSRGEGFELVLVRLDMIGVVEEIREAVLAEVRERSGRDLDDALILAATHTHAGPGRFIQGEFYSLITDSFLPAHYQRLVDDVATTILAAYDDLEPAELALVHTEAPEAHTDRRCEDGMLYSNEDTPVLFARKGDVVESAVVMYPLHSTVVGVDDLTLSRDASGAIEDFTEATLGQPGLVAMHMNTWAADQSSGTPEVDPPTGASTLPGGYDKLERLGVYMGAVVSDALSSATFTDTPALRGRTYRYAIDRDSIGYELGTFPYPYGAVYCQGGVDCDDPNSEPPEDIDSACLPFPEDSPAPLQSTVMVGELAGAHFFTWGGECGTLLAERTMDELLTLDGVDDVLFFGYANDYMGYSLTEEDWWLGGYEASGGMWGPRQGEHMALRSTQSFRNWLDGAALGYDEVPPLSPFDVTGAPAGTPEPALDVGTVVAQPADGGLGANVSFSLYGSDPWLGAPLAVLEVEVGGSWEPVRLMDEAAFDSDGYGMFVDLSYDPPFDDDVGPGQDRHFTWTFTTPTVSRISEMAGVGVGTYRYSVTVPVAGGDPLTVTSEPFDITSI